MKRLLIILIIFFSLKLSAQNYLISFAGTGGSSTVSTVIVENLTTGTYLSINGSDILHLTFSRGIKSTENRQPSEMNIYPNPMTAFSILQITPPVAGDTSISVFDINGKLLAQYQSYLDAFLQEFRLSGIGNGLFLISVKGKSYQYSEKLLCNGKTDRSIIIEKSGNTQVADVKAENNDSKGTQVTVDMAYTDGDRIKLTGISGIFRTVMTDIPASDKTITFNFIACTDGDNHNYPIVTIGTQTWMAENLKTTKYSDGTAIPNITLDANWNAAITGAYCDYKNIPDNSTTYGRQYNWYTVDNNASTKVASNGGKNVCTTSWHVPSDAEWKTLTTSLSGNAVAGSKLKEIGTIHWFYPNYATNESGFTTLPSVFRFYGYFGGLLTFGGWWSSTEYMLPNAWLWETQNDISRMEPSPLDKYNGHTVRCVRDF